MGPLMHCAGVVQTAALLQFGGATVTDLVIGPGTAEAGIRIEDDGDIIRIRSSGETDLGDWVFPKEAAGAAYEAQMTTVSGTLTSGVAGSYQGLGSSRAWIKQSTGASENYTGTLRIREVANPFNYVEGTVSLTAEVV